MTLNIEDFANGAPASSSIGSIDDYLVEIDCPSPIDAYILHSRSLLRYGNVDRLAENEHLGGLLLLGAVSAAEAYFRSILSAALEACPICRQVSAEKQINLGGALWHGHAEFRRSAFEHMSFSSKEELKKATRQFINFELKDARFKGPLDQFEMVCHLRHGLVHNGGTLPGRNAVQIEAKTYSKPVRINVSYGLLQKTVEAVDTLVLTLNRELFAEMCKRWAVDWRRRADWDPSNEDRAFRKLWSTFASNELVGPRTGRSPFSRSQCMSQVRDDYNL